MLVLDSGRTSAARIDGAPRFDAAIDAALLLTALARHAGDRVGVLVHDRRMRAAVDRAAGGAGLADVVRAVAPIEPQLVETDMTAVVAQILRRLRRRSLVVLFTALEPAALQEGLLPAIGPLLHRHVVVLASPSDPASRSCAANEATSRPSTGRPPRKGPTPTGVGLRHSSAAAASLSPKVRPTPSRRTSPTPTWA